MNMPRNCPRCGRVFVPMRRNVCPSCVEEEEKYYEDVRDYLRKHPGAMVTEICEATGVTEEILRQYIKEGRLESSAVLFEGGFDAGPKCQRCGKPVPFGRICRDCAEKLSQGFRSAAGELRSKNEARLFRSGTPGSDKD